MDLTVKWILQLVNNIITCESFISADTCSVSVSCETAEDDVTVVMMMIFH